MLKDFGQKLLEGIEPLTFPQRIECTTIVLLEPCLLEGVAIILNKEVQS